MAAAYGVQQPCRKLARCAKLLRRRQPVRN